MDRGEANSLEVRHSVILLLLIIVTQVSFAEQTSLLLSPAPGSEVEASELVVSVTVSGPLSEALNLSTARLWVDGRDVTGLCLRSGSYLSYRPIAEMPKGAVQARLEFANGVIKEWAFTIVATELIESIEHNGQEALGEYQELKVVMKAEPGLEASFSIDKERQEHPLTEASPGVYEGTYTVKPGDYFLEVPLYGHLKTGTRTASREAEVPVSLFGHLFRVQIIEPLSGKAPSNNFMIKGRTRPGSKVSIVPRLSFSSNTKAPSSRWSSDGGGGSIETRADEEGFFEIEYGIPISVPNLSVVLAVFAVTPEGERSVPITLRYSF